MIPSTTHHGPDGPDWFDGMLEKDFVSTVFYQSK